MYFETHDHPWIEHSFCSLVEYCTSWAVVWRSFWNEEGYERWASEDINTYKTHDSWVIAEKGRTLKRVHNIGVKENVLTDSIAVRERRSMSKRSMVSQAVNHCHRKTNIAVPFTPESYWSVEQVSPFSHTHYPPSSSDWPYLPPESTLLILAFL